jgi:hypothetical protein
MKLKYMLRGIGIGMVVAAALMGGYTRKQVLDAKANVTAITIDSNYSDISGEVETDEEEMSETEETVPVIVRNEGIESEVESVIESAKASESDPESQADVPAGDDAEQIQGDNAVDSNVESDNAVANNGSGEENLPTINLDAEYIEVTVSRGDDSSKVSRKLYNAGIVDSASEFDAFLAQHGYDKKITVGVKTIYSTDSWQEIAERLIQ